VVRKTHLDFQIGVGEAVESARAAMFHLFDGQVAGLKEEGLGLDVLHVKRGDKVFAGLQVFELGEVEVSLEEELDEEGMPGEGAGDDDDDNDVVIIGKSSVVL